ncbi:MAG TPA: hypothetical protein VNW47_04485 [Terriglobales bacterium]|jgi:hypothetical protein|nr:hypothetical protein [Terriglobales bacterium]
MNFTRRDQQRGKRAMEASITTVGKIRRQFSSGRPPKPGSWEPRATLLTIARRTDEIIKAMKAAKLDPRDMAAVVVVGQVAGDDWKNADHITATISHELLAEKGKSYLSALVDSILPDPSKVIIGTIYQILDRELPEPKFRQWANAAYRDVDGEAEIILANSLKRAEVKGPTFYA